MLNKNLWTLLLSLPQIVKYSDDSASSAEAYSA
jgi:hypothetical protein